MALIPVIIRLYDAAKVPARNPHFHGDSSGSYRRNEYLNTEDYSPKEFYTNIYSAISTIFFL